MVQRQNPLPGADFYSKEHWFRNERQIPQQENQSVSAPTPTPILTVPAPTPPLPQTIENILKSCGLSIKAYALIIRTENDEDRVYSSPSLASVRDSIFTDAFKSNFRKNVKRATSGLVNNRFSRPAFNQDPGFNDFETDVSSSGGYNRKHSSSGGSSSEYGRRTHHKLEDSDENGPFSAKKRRFPNYRRDESNDDTPVPMLRRTQTLTIGDTAEVERFYQTRFKDMQQSACKVMGKAFVKLVEPKKQTHHPYTKGDEKKPPWWPNTTGDNHVRHREPDHLLKPERIRLLVHILRMILQNKDDQHPTVKKLELNVQKLEDVTMEAMSNWFNDKEHPDNATKRPFLKEIFRVAKLEEKFNRGEVDNTHCISVMYGEQSGADEEESEDETKDEEDDDDEIPTPAPSASMPSPGNMISPTTAHAPQPQSMDIKRLPMRQGSLDERPQYNDNPTYYSSRSMHYNPQSPNGQDLRTYVPTTTYPSPQQSMYGNGWSMMSNGNSMGPYYITSPPQTLPTSSGTWLPPITQQQNMLPLPAVPSFHDGLSRYDTASALGNTLRTGSMSHPHQHHQLGTQFENPYMQDNGGFQQQDHDGLKAEQSHHLHNQQ